MKLLEYVYVDKNCSLILRYNWQGDEAPCYTYKADDISD